MKAKIIGNVRNDISIFPCFLQFPFKQFYKICCLYLKITVVVMYVAFIWT